MLWRRTSRSARGGAAWQARRSAQATTSRDTVQHPELDWYQLFAHFARHARCTSCRAGDCACNGMGHGGGMPVGGAVRSGRGGRLRQLCHQWHPLRAVLFHAQRSADCATCLAKRAMEMLLTGDFIDAATAKAGRSGQPRGALEALDAEVEQLVQSILDKPCAAIAMGALVYRQPSWPEAAYQLAGQTMAVNMMDAAAQGARFAESASSIWKC